jgi:hypothetical protein
VWPGGTVAAHEHLVDAVRAGHDLTVPAQYCPTPPCPDDHEQNA